MHIMLSSSLFGEGNKIIDSHVSQSDNNCWSYFWHFAIGASAKLKIVIKTSSTTFISSQMVIVKMYLHGMMSVSQFITIDWYLSLPLSKYDCIMYDSFDEQ